MAEPPLEGGAGERERAACRTPAAHRSEPDRGEAPRRISAMRLLGFDRSGPPPPQTRAGEPLRPWTIPNAIGFARLALIPVFLAVALSSTDGTGALVAALFALIAFADYLDGVAARATRQYSRLGALMDPATDRLLILAGALVAWNFRLLPRWALVVLAARELLMLALGRYALSRGVELRINWPGRLGVAPVMGSLFFAFAGLSGLAEVLLYLGLAMALSATALYVRTALGGTAGR